MRFNREPPSDSKEKGMFFMYDPSIEPEVDEHGMASWLLALIISLGVLGVAAVGAFIWWYWHYRKKSGADESTPLKDPLKEAAAP